MKKVYEFKIEGKSFAHFTISKDEFKEITGKGFTEELVKENSLDDMEDDFFEEDMHRFEVSKNQFNYNWNKKELEFIEVTA